MHEDDSLESSASNAVERTFTVKDAIQNKVPVSRPMKPVEKAGPPPDADASQRRGADSFAKPGVPMSTQLQAAVVPAAAPVQKLSVDPVSGKIMYMDDPSKKQDIIRQSNRTDQFQVVREARASRTKAAGASAKGNLRWSTYETDKFYDALRMFGTDFTLIASKFPNRTRKQIKAKFVREESANSAAVTWAVKNPFPLPDDCDPFILALPCQLRGFPEDELQRYWTLLLRELNREERRKAKLQRARGGADEAADNGAVNNGADGGGGGGGGADGDGDGVGDEEEVAGGGGDLDEFQGGSNGSDGSDADAPQKSARAASAAPATRPTRPRRVPKRRRRDGDDDDDD